MRCIDLEKNEISSQTQRIYYQNIQDLVYIHKHEEHTVALNYHLKRSMWKNVSLFPVRGSTWLIITTVSEGIKSAEGSWKNGTVPTEARSQTSWPNIWICNVGAIRTSRGRAQGGYKCFPYDVLKILTNNNFKKHDCCSCSFDFWNHLIRDWQIWWWSVNKFINEYVTKSKLLHIG